MHLETEPHFSLYIIRPDQKDISMPSPGIIVLNVTLLILLETLGNFLLFCIIFYERFGMDAQKRTVTNQLLSAMIFVQILSNVFIIPISLQTVFPGLRSK